MFESSNKHTWQLTLQLAGAQMQPWLTQRVLFIANERNFAGPTNFSDRV